MAVVLTGIWMGHFRGGMSWSSDPHLEFNWHPMLMVLGLVYLYGNGETPVNSHCLACQLNPHLGVIFVCNSIKGERLISFMLGALKVRIAA